MKEWRTIEVKLFQTESSVPTPETDELVRCIPVVLGGLRQLAKETPSANLNDSLKLLSSNVASVLKRLQDRYSSHYLDVFKEIAKIIEQLEGVHN